MPETGPVRAAGAVLWRPDRGGTQVALVHRPRYDDWTLPKGKQLPGEHVLVTAVREVAEETGMHAVLGRRLDTARYIIDGAPKLVDYWAARAADKEGAGFVPGAEVDAVEWLPVPAARDRLTYPRDVAVLDGFAAGPAATTSVILVRHAVARGKKAWREAGHADDLPRPLTRRGQVQAHDLAALLGCFAPSVVISSCAQRCLATVRPYAGLHGISVTAEPSFTVGGGGPAGAAATRQRVTQIVERGVPAVVCAHRENLPALLAWACQRLSAGVPDGPALRKGSFWVLQVGEGRLVSAEQHHPGAGG